MFRFKKFDNCYVYISVSGLLSQVGSKYREELKINLCTFGKSMGNSGGKKWGVASISGETWVKKYLDRELVQILHGLGFLGFDVVIRTGC